MFVFFSHLILFFSPPKKNDATKPNRIKTKFNSRVIIKKNMHVVTSLGTTLTFFFAFPCNTLSCVCGTIWKKEMLSAVYSCLVGTCTIGGVSMFSPKLTRAAMAPPTMRIRTTEVQNKSWKSLEISSTWHESPRYLVELHVQA